ncbi:MAG TPA: hypothetical protein VNG90_01055 [Candidatus Acidoferrum sp.]|nr:hypothetical protein [Candidatus Acidoferrum sp.]
MTQIFLRVEDAPELQILVDVEDKDLADPNQHKWYRTGKVYIYKWGRDPKSKKSRTFSLGRLIFARHEGVDFDDPMFIGKLITHRNGQAEDFRRDNLELTKRRWSKPPTTWLYVHHVNCRKSFVAQVVIDGQTRYLGCFACEVNAALVVKKALYAHGLPYASAIPAEFIQDEERAEAGERDPQFIKAGLARLLPYAGFTVPNYENTVIFLGSLELRIRTLRYSRKDGVGEVAVTLYDAAAGCNLLVLDDWHFRMLSDERIVAETGQTSGDGQLFAAVKKGRYQLALVLG